MLNKHNKEYILSRKQAAHAQAMMNLYAAAGNRKEAERWAQIEANIRNNMKQESMNDSRTNN